MSLPGTHFLDTTLRLPGAQLPVRTAVLDLTNARVMLSPGSLLTPEQHRQAGSVTDIVAPSLLHTAGMKGAAEAHPNARLWGPAGVREKLPGLKWHGELGVDPWPYESELPFVALAGMPKAREHVFLHHASKALFVTDLAFNLTDPKGLGARLIYSLFGTYRRFAVSRLFLLYAKDRAALARSLEPIATLDFRHVVPSHGEALLDDGKARLLAAFRERGLVT